MEGHDQAKMSSAFREQLDPRKMIDRAGAMEELGIQLDRNGDALNRLEDRLVNVLHPAEPASEVPSLPSPGSPLRGAAERLSSLNSRLEELIGRLDL